MGAVYPFNGSVYNATRRAGVFALLRYRVRFFYKASEARFQNEPACRFLGKIF